MVGPRAGMWHLPPDMELVSASRSFQNRILLKTRLGSVMEF